MQICLWELIKRCDHGVPGKQNALHYSCMLNQSVPYAPVLLFLPHLYLARFSLKQFLSCVTDHAKNHQEDNHIMPRFMFRG